MRRRRVTKDHFYAYNINEEYLRREYVLHPLHLITIFHLLLPLPFYAVVKHNNDNKKPQ